ncbi:MAG: hypothetical protein QNJ46_05145 [Leptolyngbyaceae cyanobacterium MO_188.B28]|nr:hypothetical protein [Leptolyngbyaceae cyanobacterium MO_188.B28]
MKLGEILVHKGLLSQSKLEQVIKMQSLSQTTNRKLGELLVDFGIIDNSVLEQALREQHWRNKGFWVID